MKQRQGVYLQSKFLEARPGHRTHTGDHGLVKEWETLKMMSKVFHAILLTPVSSLAGQRSLEQDSPTQDHPTAVSTELQPQSQV